MIEKLNLAAFKSQLSIASWRSGVKAQSLFQSHGFFPVALMDMEKNKF